MEKMLFGGRVKKNIVFGLSFLIIPWIALVSLIMDKDQLDVEEKRELVSVFFALAIAMVALVTIIGSVVTFALGVCCIIAAIQAFRGKTFHIPGAYHLAKLIIK